MVRNCISLLFYSFERDRDTDIQHKLYSLPFKFFNLLKKFPVLFYSNVTIATLYNLKEHLIKSIGRYGNYKISCKISPNHLIIFLIFDRFVLVCHHYISVYFDTCSWPWLPCPVAHVRASATSRSANIT